MNRAELDAFFARADDVLEDWEPSTDAMVAHPPDPDTDPDLPPAVDSYYQQRARMYYVDGNMLVSALAPVVVARSYQDALRHAGRAAGRVNEAFYRLISAGAGDGPLPPLRHPTPIAPPAEMSPRERALRARQHRNVGPADRWGIDGHYRRRTEATRGRSNREG